MRFRLLGPLEIQAGEDDWRGIGAPKWRSVLAALLINAGQIVPAPARGARTTAMPRLRAVLAARPSPPAPLPGTRTASRRAHPARRAGVRGAGRTTPVPSSTECLP